MYIYIYIYIYIYTYIAPATNNGDRKVIFKNCVPFTDCTSKTNKAQIDNAKDIDVVMSIYYSIEHSDNYLEACKSLYKYYRNEQH